MIYGLVASARAAIVDCQDTFTQYHVLEFDANTVPAALWSRRTLAFVSELAGTYRYAYATANAAMVHASKLNRPALAQVADKAFRRYTAMADLMFALWSTDTGVVDEPG